MTDLARYNIDLCKGTGLIQESIILLGLYKPGMKHNELAQHVISLNALAKTSDARTKDIVSVAFYKRFVNSNPQVPSWLFSVFNLNIGVQVLSQLFLIYTARANRILFDFILDVYWPLVRRNQRDLDSSVARKFIADTISESDLIKGWSDSTQIRVSSYLISTLVDFRFLDVKRNILPIFLNDFTANYLAHELHFNNLSDNSIVDAKDWALFGYSKVDVINHLERLSFKGHFIFQNSGELIKINWKYKTMEDFLDAFR
jgi:hypothetical protein